MTRIVNKEHLMLNSFGRKESLFKLEEATLISTKSCSSGLVVAILTFKMVMLRFVSS